MIELELEGFHWNIIEMRLSRTYYIKWHKFNGIYRAFLIILSIFAFFWASSHMKGVLSILHVHRSKDNICTN